MLRQPSTDPNAKFRFKELVAQHDMLAFLQTVNTEFNWDANDEEQVKNRVQEKREELVAKIAEAKEKFGQVEIVEGQLALASYALRSGTKEEAEEYWKQVDLNPSVTLQRRL